MTAESRRLVVRLDALAANVRAFASTGAGLIARVDHDGFGHGLVPVARTCIEAGAVMLAVADFDEACRLRESGISIPLLVLRPHALIGSGDGPMDAVYAAVATEGEALTAARLGASGAHLVVDCGSAMRGIRPDDAGEVHRIGKVLPIAALMGVADPSTPHAEASTALEVAGENAPGVPRHLHGTAGVLAGFGEHDAYVRVGRGLYGIPMSDGTPTGACVMRLSGQVVTVKSIRAGEGVSYGYIYRAPRDGTIALVTCGYADGIPRSLGNHATVVVNGRSARIIGRVAMDVVVIELGESSARPGDEVVFLGDRDEGESSVAEWASITGLDPVELATSIGPRVVRSYTR